MSGWFACSLTCCRASARWPSAILSLEQLLGGIIALLVGLTFHEFSHALLADSLGDRRPRAMGRLTLNPIPHIDPLGALMLVVAGFG